MSQPTTQGRVPRLLERDGNFQVTRVGAGSEHSNDLYHFLLTTSWPRFLALVGGAYFVTNVLFAVAYALGGACVAGARPGSIVDAFFFSIQTIATIGYGSMVPATPYAHALVALEALVGLLGFAMATGLMFAKFSRPTARVVFSKVAMLSERNGVPTLTFRVANLRSNQIVEASMKLVLLRFETTAEGERLRRFHELLLVRSQNPIFALTWLVQHPIDERSPLHGATMDELCEEGADLLAILVGIDGTFSQTIHARFGYRFEDVVVGGRFVDMVDMEAKGRSIHLDRIHDFTRLVPEDPADWTRPLGSLRKAQTPVEPYPPAPRAVASSAGTTSTSARATGQTTS